MLRWANVSGSSIGGGRGCSGLDPRVLADGIEQFGERSVPVPDHEPCPAAEVFEVHDEVLRRLGYSRGERMRRGAQDADPATAVFDHHEHVYPYP